MKLAPGIVATIAALAFAGCGQLDLTPEGDPARVLAGRVELSDGALLPAGAAITVRVVDAFITGMPPQALGSQTIHSPGGGGPIEFRVEYRAEDELLRRGLNVEVRISYGGRVRYFNRNQYAVNLGNAVEVHRISVNPAEH
jgi:uncharacterized lipoprotein YbaY